MTAQSLAARGRRAATRLMGDACTITRASGDATMDPVTLQLAQPTTTVYSGVCRLQSQAQRVFRPQVGERAQDVMRLVLQIPLVAAVPPYASSTLYPSAELFPGSPASVVVQVDDVVTITSAFDDQLVGRTFVVVGTEVKSQATMRRFVIEEHQS